MITVATSTLNWWAVGSTTVNMINASYPFIVLFTGMFVALLAIGGIIYTVIKSIKPI